MMVTRTIQEFQGFSLYLYQITNLNINDIKTIGSVFLKQFRSDF